ncbi:MAG: acetyl-CoA hydrolase/transferase C-terminal domain-containing protein [Halobacteriota archaeon]|uniref:acetyl-CoA hydrolase/transferase C-terminal domain-containing protein n=1 Tax=Natronomonas sp. TaxID=2184060 RepID=UPI00397699C1
MTAVAEREHGDLPIVSAETASEHVPDDGIVVVSGFGSVGYPKSVPLALAESDRDLSLTVISGGSVGEEIDETLADADAIARRFPYQARSGTRTRINGGEMAFADAHIASFGDRVRVGEFGTPDVAIVEAIAAGPDWLIPSTSIGHTPAYVAAADRIIVELNEVQPLSLQHFHDVYVPDPPPHREPIQLRHPAERIGSPTVSFDSKKLVAAVRTARPDTPYTFRETTPDDESIAAKLIGFVEGELERNPYLDERLCLQFGVGSLGNALMGGFEDLDVGDRDLIYFGEVIQDGLLDMLGAGKLESASAASLALSKSHLERLFENPDDYADNIVVRNADVSNNPALIDRFGVIAVNSALEIDLYGNVNSTHIGGKHLQNGIGGGGDFNRNALISITALSSVASGGEIPRIVPMVPHVDHTEHDVSVVITEQGVADLRGLSPRERADELIENCAHPSYRPALRSYLDRSDRSGGHVPHDLDEAFSSLERRES